MIIEKRESYDSLLCYRVMTVTDLPVFSAYSMVRFVPDDFPSHMASTESAISTIRIFRLIGAANFPYLA